MSNSSKNKRYLINSRGKKIYTQLSPSTAGEPEALIVFLHDYALHSSLYQPFFEKLNREALSVYSFDFEGFGQSAGLKGDIREFVYYVDDLQQIIQSLDEELQKLPLILMGHGMGALVAQAASERLKEKISATVHLAPIFRFSSQVPKIIRDAVKYISTMAATFPILKLDRNLFSENEEICKMIEQDEFTLKGKLRARMASHLVTSGKKMRSRIARVALPTLILQGEGDRLVEVNFMKDALNQIDNSHLDVAWLEDAGHLFPIESKSDDAISLIKSWIVKQEIIADKALSN